MLNREIPYRPRLEGNFRIRFYNAVSEICETTPITRIEAIVANELDWVENKCAYNIEQRKNIDQFGSFLEIWYDPHGMLAIVRVSYT